MQKSWLEKSLLNVIHGRFWTSIYGNEIRNDGPLPPWAGGGAQYLCPFIPLQVLIKRAPPLIRQKNVTNETFSGRNHIKNFQAFKMVFWEPWKGSPLDVAKKRHEWSFFSKGPHKELSNLKYVVLGASKGLPPWFGQKMSQMFFFSKEPYEKLSELQNLVWHMFCWLACHDPLEVPQYHRELGG